MTRTNHHPWLARYAVLTAAMTLALICVGGLVTSHEAGLAVPDWPTTYGYNMFFFPISKWVGGVLYEHSHRLVASLVGLMTVALAVWLWIKEERAWLRRLGIVAVGLVVAQGVLGGLRVTALKDELGIFHATLAQLFFVLVSAMALFLSKAWPRGSRTGFQPVASGILPVSAMPANDTRARSRRWQAGSPPYAAASPLENSLSANLIVYARRRLRYLSAFVTGMILVQLILGATMRHQHAGLAIPDFPRAYGLWWPETTDAAVARYNQLRRETTAVKPITVTHVRLQMAHRILACLIVLGVIAVAVTAVSQFGFASGFGKVGLTWLALIAAQFALGMATIWTNKSADIATAHVAVGALSLVTGALLVLLTGQTRAASVETARDARSEAVPESRTVAEEVHFPA